jgi:hypothetical protein
MERIDRLCALLDRIIMLALKAAALILGVFGLLGMYTLMILHFTGNFP